MIWVRVPLTYLLAPTQQPHRRAQYAKCNTLHLISKRVRSWKSALSQHPQIRAVIQTSFHHGLGSILIACPFAWWSTVWWREVTESWHHSVHRSISNMCCVNSIRALISRVIFFLNYRSIFMFSLHFSFFQYGSWGEKRILKNDEGTNKWRIVVWHLWVFVYFYLSVAVQGQVSWVHKLSNPLYIWDVFSRKEW